MKKLTENNAKRRILIPPERGLVYDRNNKLIAKNDSIIDIMIIPKELKLNTLEDSINLCNYFNISISQLSEKIEKLNNIHIVKDLSFLKKFHFLFLKIYFNFLVFMNNIEW